jgi:hypothetical protein
MADTRILRRAIRDETKRTVLREAEARYRHALMDEDERMMLEQCIKDLRHQHGIKA